MSEKAIVVHGAVVKCKYSVAPKTDKLKVLSHKKHFANDNDASSKLIATDKEIGQTLEKNTFGNCKMQPNGSSYNPCQAVITKWDDFYEKVTLSNKGKILLENSKATCPIGGASCITIVKHGQKASGSKQQTRQKDEKVSHAINPLSVSVEMEQETALVE
jgi:hypothetical protein